MENLSYFRHPNRSASSLSKKACNGTGGFSYGSGNTSNTATTYDDVFGGSTSFGAPTLSPRLEDYCEIFAGFNGSSRAAVSSIPLLDLPLVDDRDVYFDVRSHGFDYREVFGGFNDLDLAPSYEELFMQRSGDCDSSDDAWTPEEVESFSGGTEHSGKSPSFSNGRDSYDSIDGSTQFNISYNKTSEISDRNFSNGVIRVADLSAIPGYTVTVDEMIGSGGTTKLKKENGGTSSYAFEDKDMAQKYYNGAISFPSEPFVTVSEIGLKTHPTGTPPPSRPPPILKSNFRSSACNSRTTGSEGSADSSSPPFFDVEVDASSAEAKLKSAKEQLERKRGGAQTTTKRISIKNRMTEEEKTSHTACLPALENNIDVARNSLRDKHRSKSLSSQGSDNSNDEWEEGTQFVELVRTEQPRNVDENLEAKKLLKHPGTRIEEARVKEEDERIEGEAFEKAETKKKLKAALEQEEKEKMLKEAHEKEENERRVAEARKKAERERKMKEQEEYELRLKEAFEKEEKKRRMREAREKERKMKFALEQEKERKIKEAREKEEDERRIKEARSKAELDQRLKETLEREEKERRIKEFQEREENERRAKEVLEQAENERKLKEALEQAENERKLKEALEQNEKERRVKEGREKEENEKKLKEAIELEEKEKRLIEAFERAEAERRLEEDLEQEEMRMRLQETNEREDRERTHRENQEDQEYEMKQHQYKGEESDEKQRDACKMEKTCETTEEALGEQWSNESLSDTLEEGERVANQISVNNQKEEERTSQRESMSKEACPWEDFEKNLKDASQQEGTDELDAESRLLERNEEAPKLGENGESAEEASFVTVNIQGGKLEQKSTNFESSKDASVLKQDVGMKTEVEERSEGVVIEDENVRKVGVGRDQRNQVESTCAPKTSSGSRNHEDKFTHQQERGSIYETQGGLNQDAKLERPLPSRVFMQPEKEAEKLKQESDFDMERLRKIEEEREREREREKDRMAFDQRALADARERLEKACAEAREKSLPDKSSIETRLRAERAAVERATAEARERAADKVAFEARDRMERSVSDKQFKSSGFFGERMERSVSDKQFQNSASFGDSRYQNSPDGESPQRCTSRLERHRRTADRVAKALAEKNMRDLVAQREQAERIRISETVDAEVKRWSSGKEGNIRALLSTLQYILGPESGWQPLPLTEVITSGAVKRAYRKATLCVHPDKLQQRGANIHQKYICEKVFDLLKEAWNRFNSEER